MTTTMRWTAERPGGGAVVPRHRHRSGNDHLDGGMQLYTAGWLTERKGKGGAVYGQAHGVCLETQHFPNAVNCPAFPSPILRKGETLQQWTAFRFFAR
ncbi:MAG: hypothetical protein ACLU38_08365 [Dysosmobacter sp.]